MGSVWLAEHLSLHTSVVVKFMASELARSPESVRRFSREAAMAAQVRSPYVVSMLDHGVADGMPYIVMEHLEGEDLGVRLARLGRLPPGEVDEIVRQLACALSSVHARGIVHRDIKPANVFLCRSEPAGQDIFVKLLDFGIAKSQRYKIDNATTDAGAVLGTPWYMSPEQLAGSKVQLDARADLWAVGVLVFEALTGRRPFSADTLGEQILLVHIGETPSLGEPALDAWFAKACARAPEDRFASASELTAQLSAALRGAVLAPPPPAEPAKPFADTVVQAASTVGGAPRAVGRPRPARVPLLVAMGAAIVGASVAAGVLGTTSHPEAPPPRVELPLPTTAAAFVAVPDPPASASMAPPPATASVAAKIRPHPRVTPSVTPSARTPPRSRDDDIE